jgi:hypothetical protein
MWAVKALIKEVATLRRENKRLLADIKIVDSNWLWYDGHHGKKYANMSESRWAIDKGLSMLTGRKSRYC